MITYKISIVTPTRIIEHEIDNMMPKITIDAYEHEENSLLGSDERDITLEKEVENDL